MKLLAKTTFLVALLLSTTVVLALNDNTDEGDTTNVEDMVDLQSLEEYPPVDILFFNMFIDLSSEGKHSESVSEFRKWAAAEPGNPMWPLGIGMVKSRMCQRSSAEKYFKKAISLSQNSLHSDFVTSWVEYYRAINHFGKNSMNLMISKLWNLKATTTRDDIKAAVEEALARFDK